MLALLAGDPSRSIAPPPLLSSSTAVPFHLLFRSDWDTLPVTPIEPTVGMSPAPSLDTPAVSDSGAPLGGTLGHCVWNMFAGT